jgi:E3 ubiquitin-protein ligase BRE1
LRTSLEENSLELRVRAANETETACQRRLSIAEAELEEIRAEVDASERLVICSWRQLDMRTTAISNW